MSFEYYNPADSIYNEYDKEIHDLKAEMEILWHRVGEGLPPDGVRCNVVGYDDYEHWIAGYNGEYSRDAIYEKGVWTYSSTSIVLGCVNVMFWRVAQGKEIE